MKTNYNYTKNQDRDFIISYLEKTKFKRVIDVGYSANAWSSAYVTHYVDVIDSGLDKIFFKGDINDPDVWKLIEQDVQLNGKFDFCICTHTFEDIINPLYASKMMEKYSNAGYVAVPSKYLELTNNIENYWKGYIHHRYIFNKEGDAFVGYPKMGFLEGDQRCDNVSNHLSFDNRELQFFWKDTIGMKIINANYLGPNIDCVLGYYNTLLSD